VTTTTWASLALITMTSVPALAQQKIGIVQMQSAIVGTQEGQKAASDLEARMAPRRKELETKQQELQRLQASLQKTDPAAEQGRAQLARDFDSKSKDYKRTLEDAQAQFQGDQDRLMNDLGGKLLAVISKYAKDQGYAMVIDVSNPQTPVMYASETIDITKDVIDLYNRNSGGGAPSAKPAPAPAVKPAASTVK
jgi:outer membrane protein